jgi:hypothetical protein
VFLKLQLGQINEILSKGMVKLPSVRFLINGRSCKVATDSDRIEAERLQIYEKISLSNFADAIEEYYEIFSISIKNKHRKLALAESICKPTRFYVELFFLMI